MSNRKTIAVLSAAVVASISAQRALANTVDGTVSNGEYANSVLQNNATGFGNNQSELNGAYWNYTPNGNLELAIPGNLELSGGNPNRFVMFIDSKAGGAMANSVAGGFGQFGSVAGAGVDDWGTDTDGGPGVTATPGGSILSPNFNPDYALEINNFNGTYYTNVIDLTQPNDDTHPNKDVFLGGNTVGGPAVTQTYFRDGGATDSGDVTHIFDNSNLDGVSDTDASGAASGVKGFEFNFENQFIAHQAGQPIRMMAFVTNGDGNFLSNQFLPGLGGGVPNLGFAGGDGGAVLFDGRFFGDQRYLNIFTPTLTAGTTWSTATFTGGAVPNGPEQAANLTGASAATITLDTIVGLGFLNLNNPGGYTFQGNTLVFNGGAGAAGLFVPAGLQDFQNTVKVQSDTRVHINGGAGAIFDGPFSISSGKGIYITGGGTLTIAGAQSHAPGANIALDDGFLNLLSDAGNSATAPADRPNLFASTPGGGAGASVVLQASQHLNSLTANPAGVVQLFPGGNRIIVANNVAASGNGRIDITNNKMIVNSTPIGTLGTGNTYTGVTGLIQSGRNGGNWSGGGIVTTQTQATTSNFTSIGVATAGQVKGIAASATAVWGGQTVTGSDTLVMYTYGGDANLDGKINVDDYGHIDSSVVLPGASGWFNGDFNYDGKVNVDDYGIIDSNVPIQGAPFPASSAAFANTVSAVPEPTVGALVVTGIATATLRRRRRGS
jgi:hypothetical protein